MRFLIHCFLAFLIAPLCTAEEEKWKVFEGCTLIENEANDGDSFHVAYLNRSYIFRLYWVDAPETDNRYPDRLRSQATDMGISEQDVIPLGNEATNFTRKILQKPFTVYTTYEDARGASTKKRYYAMVETEQGFLSQALIENGFARIKGWQPDPPGPLSRRTYNMRLAGIAKENKSSAKTTRPSTSTPRPNMVGQTIIAKRSILIFKAQPPHTPAGKVKPGTAITILDETTAGRVKVTFDLPSGRRYTGLCLKTDLITQ